jgi:hypothetical protein
MTSNATVTMNLTIHELHMSCTSVLCLRDSSLD